MLYILYREKKRELFRYFLLRARRRGKKTAGLCERRELLVYIRRRRFATKFADLEMISRWPTVCVYIPMYSGEMLSSGTWNFPNKIRKKFGERRVIVVWVGEADVYIFV